jgi:hypothetical protein
MENGSMLRDRVEPGAQRRAALARVVVEHVSAASKAKKQPLI